MQERSLKIYKPNDIDGLLNIDKLKQKTSQECAQLLAETKQKCATLEQETYDKAMAQFRVEQEKLFEQTFKKVNNFFDSVKQDINDLLKVIFDKLKIEDNSIKILTGLLFVEVEKLKIKSNKFTVFGNHEILPVLQKNIKEEFADKDNLNFDFDIKEDLTSEECLIESEYIMARISVSDFQEKVLNILSNHNMVD